MTLLRRWESENDSLAEVLITGYTHDLTFLEQYFVPRVRHFGARLTILTDADQGLHDPVDVRHAGRTYQHANARCGGAFHPKLVVFVGEENVWVAIGSGNPTMSGWGYNNELWLVVEATRRSGPSAFVDLATWLTRLPDVVEMPEWTAQTLATITAMIRPAEILEPPSGLRILGNLDIPILDELPGGPVASLGISAPFHDRESAAVRALVTRFEPESLTVALQPSQTRFHGESLVAAVSSVPQVTFRAIEDDRTSHGKLIEWQTARGRVALVGSPNLSRAALLTTTWQRGNCELAVWYSAPLSLVPGGVSLPVREVRSTSTIRADSTPRPAAPVTLLGARCIKNGIQLELLLGRAGLVIIETSPTGAPGSWHQALRLQIAQPGRTTTVLQTIEAAGAAIRGHMDVDGRHYFSSVVFATDTVRCQPRSFDPSLPRLAVDYAYGDVINDPALAEQFHANLLRLMNTIAEHRVTTPSGSTATQTAARFNDDRWGAWIQHLQQTVGPSLAGLLFPGEGRADTERSEQWSIDMDYSLDLADEDSDLDDEPRIDGRQPLDLDPSQHGAWRRWAGKLRGNLARNPLLPLEIRMLVNRLYLNLLAAGLWGPDDEWRTGFAEVLTTLRPTDEEYDALPMRAADALCTLIAVGLALLFQDANLHGGAAEDTILRSAWKELGEWAAYADENLVDEYLIPSSRGYSRIPGEGGIIKVIELARSTADDPHAQIRETLEAEGIEAEFYDGAWVARIDSNPRKLAARIATYAGNPCTVIVFSNAGNCTVIRCGSTLAFGDARTRRWRIYPISAVGSPITVLGSPDGLPSTRANFRLTPPPASVTALAEEAETNLARLLAVLVEPGH
ncbi:hypothetical protein [Nocardia tengchongensis]|uniref:hypothetical protein n=1 Tax=Nocardia tengchongensis TaxID=2055889 RepID=UPI003606D8AA